MPCPKANHKPCGKKALHMMQNMAATQKLISNQLQAFYRYLGINYDEAAALLICPSLIPQHFVILERMPVVAENLEPIDGCAADWYSLNTSPVGQWAVYDNINMCTMVYSTGTSISKFWGILQACSQVVRPASAPNLEYRDCPHCYCRINGSQD